MLYDFLSYHHIFIYILYFPFVNFLALLGVHLGWVACCGSNFCVCKIKSESKSEHSFLKVWLDSRRHGNTTRWLVCDVRRCQCKIDMHFWNQFWCNFIMRTKTTTREKRGQEANDVWSSLVLMSRPYDWRPWLTLLETDMISSMLRTFLGNVGRIFDFRLKSWPIHAHMETLFSLFWGQLSRFQTVCFKRPHRPSALPRSQSAFCLQRKWCNRPLPLEWSEREQGDSSRTACEAHGAVLGLFLVTHYHGSSLWMMSHRDSTPL